MRHPARAVCVLLTLVLLLGGCGGKSKRTAYPIPPPAAPGEDTPSAEVSENLAMALGPDLGTPTLEEKRAKLPKALVGDTGNAAYSGERLTGTVTAPVPVSTPPPAPLAKAPPAVPRIPVEQKATLAAPPAPAPAQAAAETAPVPTAPAPASAPAAPPAPTANLAGAGRVTAQLASFRTRANAEGGWQRLRAAHPDQLGDRSLILQEKDLGERGIYYRVRTGPFADVAAAKAFCEEMRARDQACVVVRPE